MSIINWITLGILAVNAVLLVIAGFYLVKAEYYLWVRKQRTAYALLTQYGFTVEPVDESIRAFLLRRGVTAK